MNPGHRCRSKWVRVEDPLPTLEGIPYEDWPETDRRAWQEALAPGDELLVEPGALARLAGPTVKTRRYILGRYLRCLEIHGDLNPEEPVAARFTPERVDRFLAYRVATVSPLTARQDAQHLSLLLRDLVPGADGRWIRRRPSVPAHAAAMASRRHVEPFNPGELVARSAARLGRPGQEQGPVTRAKALRDHAILMLGVFLKHRVSNLAGLREGTSLRMGPERVWAVFEGKDTKTGAPIHAAIEGEALQALQRYLRRGRPVLLGERADPGELWLSVRGTPMTAAGLRFVFAQRGQELLGRHMNPHLVRATYATTLRMADPTSLQRVANGLGHKSTQVTLRHYDRSGAAAAEKMWQSRVRKMRRKG